MTCRLHELSLIECKTVDCPCDYCRTAIVIHMRLHATWSPSQLRGGQQGRRTLPMLSITP